MMMNEADAFLKMSAISDEYLLSETCDLLKFMNDFPTLKSFRYQKC
jgi:hypothetical protein